MKNLYRVGASAICLCLAFSASNCTNTRIALAGLSGPVYRTDVEMSLNKSARQGTTDPTTYVLGDGLKYRIVGNESGVNNIKMIPKVGYNWPKPVITGGTTTHGTTSGAITTGGTIINGSVANATATNSTVVGGTVTNATISSVTIISSGYAGAPIAGGTISNGVISANTISGGTISGGTISGGTISGGIITAGIVTGGISTNGTITGGTSVGGITIGGTTTGATIAGGAAISPLTNSTVVGGTSTNGTLTGGTTACGATTGGTITAGITTGANITGGTITTGTIVGGTTANGITTGATIINATITGSTVVGGTSSNCTVNGGSTIAITTTGGTIVNASLIGGTVTGGSRVGMTPAEVFAEAKAATARNARDLANTRVQAADNAPVDQKKSLETIAEKAKEDAEKAENEANDAAIIVARITKPNVVYITTEDDKDPTAFFEEIEKHETFTITDANLTQQNKVIVNQVALSALVLPIKIRPAREFDGKQYERQFATDVSIGPFIGYRFKFKGNNYKSFTTVGGFAGPTLINYVSTTNQTGTTTTTTTGSTTTTTTTPPTSTPSNGVNPDNMIGLTYGLGVVHEINGFQLGLIYGWDRVSGTRVKDWPYDGKGWISLAIGYSFLTNR